MKRDIEKKQITSLMNPLKKKSVVYVVIEKLKEAMLNKELKPGDFLPSENELSRSLGVGKTTVREAIKMLEAMGVVEIKQGLGTYIPISPNTEGINPLIFQLLLGQASNDSLIELRQIFEPAYSLLAMKKCEKEEIDRIQLTVELFEQKIKAGTQTKEDDFLFHEAILECTHNSYIIMLGRTIHHLFQASITKSMNRIPQVALEDHKRILEAFKTKDPERLLDAIQNSFKGWMTSLDL